MFKTATELSLTIQNEEIRKYLDNFPQKQFIGTLN